VVHMVKGPPRWTPGWPAFVASMALSVAGTLCINEGSVTLAACLWGIAGTIYERGCWQP
jgi:hypothetical protein